jgi:hypothetical protein
VDAPVGSPRDCRRDAIAPALRCSRLAEAHAAAALPAVTGEHYDLGRPLARQLRASTGGDSAGDIAS